MTAALSRTVKRARFSVEQRVELLEDDGDSLEEAIDRLSDRLSKILWAMTGLIISTSTGVVLFALNLAVHK